jgi:hypothetical protein
MGTEKFGTGEYGVLYVPGRAPTGTYPLLRKKRTRTCLLCRKSAKLCFASSPVCRTCASFAEQVQHREDLTQPRAMKIAEEIYRQWQKEKERVGVC